ncbi:MAG: hypothetical protein P4L40_02590 [Terracidiphilus sp.]|nr:hypothetical protein [Terracidiphilus sp.]
MTPMEVKPAEFDVFEVRVSRFKSVFDAERISIFRLLCMCVSVCVCVCVCVCMSYHDCHAPIAGPRGASQTAG